MWINRERHKLAEAIALAAARTFVTSFGTPIGDGWYRLCVLPSDDARWIEKSVAYLKLRGEIVFRANRSNEVRLL